MGKIQKHKKHNFCESQHRNNNTALISSTYTTPPNLKPDGHHKITATQKKLTRLIARGRENPQIHKSTTPNPKKKFKNPPTMELPWASKKLRFHRFLETPVRTPAEVRTSNDSPSCSSSWNPTIAPVLCKFELLAPLLLSVDYSIDRSIDLPSLLANKLGFVGLFPTLHQHVHIEAPTKYSRLSRKLCFVVVTCFPCDTFYKKSLRCKLMF